VGKIAVDADRQHIHIQLLKLRILDGNCRQFSRSNASEVSWVEAKHHPFAAVVGEMDLLGRAFMIRRGGEIRRAFAYLDAHWDGLLSFGTLA
jgi:hypothetical protein